MGWRVSHFSEFFLFFHPWFEIMLIISAVKRTKINGKAIKFESLKTFNISFCEFKSAYQLRTQNLVFIDCHRMWMSVSELCRFRSQILLKTTENSDLIRRIWIFWAWKFLWVKFIGLQRILRTFLCSFKYFCYLKFHGELVTLLKSVILSSAVTS